MNRVPACLAASVLLLSGCATSGEYPSLARRRIEGSVGADPAICAAKGDITLPGDEPGRIAGSAEPAPAIDVPPPPQPPSADLTARLAQLVEQAEAAHARFNANRAQAERAVGAGSGSAEGSDAWSNASLALSVLESARSNAQVALAELDQRYGQAGVDGNDPLVAEAIAAARDRVDALVAEENAVLTRLRERLR